MKTFRIIFLLSVYATLVSPFCLAQSSDLEARSACLNGEEAFDREDYTKAIVYLKEAKVKLGETKPRIQYTLVRALKAAGRYAEAKTELKTFFDVTPEDNTEPHFLEMIKNITDLNEAVKLEEEKVRQAQLKEQERLATIERERKEREAIQLEEQRQAELKRKEAERLVLAENQRMAVIGKWSKVSSSIKEWYEFDYFDITINNGELSISIDPKFAGNMNSYKFSVKGQNCPSNSLSFCREVEGNIFVENHYGISHGRPSKPSEFNLPIKMYTISNGNLVFEVEQFLFKSSTAGLNLNFSRDRIFFTGETVKIQFKRRNW